MSRPRPTSALVRPDDVFYELSEINDYIVLGGAPAVTIDRIRALGVTCVINVTPLPNLPVAGVDYLRIAVDDVPTAPLAAHFDTAADTVELHRRRGGRTLIHCVAGVSRSATLVLAHQVKHAGLSLREAFQRLRARRRVVRPNAGFFAALVEFERRVRGAASVRMVRHPAGGAELIPDVYESEYRRLIGWAEWLRSKGLESEDDSDSTVAEDDSDRPTGVQDGSYWTTAPEDSSDWAIGAEDASDWHAGPDDREGQWRAAIGSGADGAHRRYRRGHHAL